ncbi:MAG: ABC transporter ATP-binding protein [Betaproteobacteria bacterium]|nr:ABC transporter ATP-binding protein [Betaproteobacteria bacterium]
MPEANSRQLVLENVIAGYGPTVVLDGISLAFDQGETVAVLGRNGMGKTTLLETVMGFTTFHGGRIGYTGESIEGWPTWRRSRSGVSLVPQEREIFPSLTVEENLRVAARGGQWTTERAFDLFPRLAERRRNRGNQLSGGEQQMLAVARALMGSPALLLLDEPLEGLAPIIVDALVAALERLRKETAITMLLVEQHALLALEFAPRAVALVRGKVVYDGPSDALTRDAQRLSSLIGVA